ncbi:MAG: nucleotidyltransferase domain-containing protein [Armatimonadota bacterium]
MLARSLSSSVLRWPEPVEVNLAVRGWAERTAEERPEVLRIGYFGSYARGDWGVGSDLDVVIIVDHANLPWERRSAAWDVTDLPVPADLFVYTLSEWERLLSQSGFHRTVEDEAVWVYGRYPSSGQ